MNTQSESGNKWQLSLSNVLVFVLAIGLWFALILSGTPELAMVALILLPAGLIAAISAWAQKRYAVILLACLFELIVIGGSVLMVGNYMSRLALSRRKNQVLSSISYGMNSYYSDWHAYPLPPTDPKLCGAELARYLSMSGQNAPYLRYWNELEGQRSKTILSGGTGNALTWALQGKDILILIDVGNDGVAGKYSVEETNIRKIPCDANQDGIDDGMDDMVDSRTRGEHR